MQKIRDGLEVNDTFLDKQIFVASQDLTHLFANFSNYLTSDLIQENFFSNSEKDLSIR